MRSLLLEARKQIVFCDDPLKFSSNCQAFISDISRHINANHQDKNAVLAVAADICLDLQSFLPKWVLKKHMDRGLLSQDAIEEGIQDIMLFIKGKGGESTLEYIKKEAEEISQSSIRKMCELELDGRLHTYWGHDYCSGLNHSFRRGARFVTSNPAKINLFRKDWPDTWAGLVAEVKARHPGISLERLISYLFLKVAAISARDLYPVFEASDGKFGFVCVQVNPKNWKDSDKMAEEIEFWNEAFKEELNTNKPNIVYKIPAVSAAPKTVERIVKQGIRVCLTLNFSFSQHEIFADLIEKGEQNGFVVLMSGFLDDAVDRELNSLGIDNSKDYSRHAGEAVIRKSYANLIKRGCRKTSILAAAIRGPWTIKNSISDRADAPLYFTTMTEKILEFDAAKPELRSVTHEAVPDEIMSVLRRSSIFNAAYERDLISLDNIDEYVPLQTVHGAFAKAYIELEESLA